MKIPLLQKFEPPKPLKIYDYHDLNICLFASEVKPKQFSLSQLKQAKIIPEHWQLKLPVTKKANLLHLSFLQGLNISIYQKKINFAQKIIKEDIDLSTIINKFINYFKTYKYNQLQIIINRIITLPSTVNSTDKFIQNILLNGLDWEILGHKPNRQQVNYYYPDLPCPLMLNVIDFPLKSKKLQSNSCLVFRGVFDYKITEKSLTYNHQEILAIIAKYQENINIFKQIIDQDLLNF